MRLADRLFAFRLFPAWTDPVQVLLWAMGWLLVFAFAVLALLVGPAMLRAWTDLPSSGAPLWRLFPLFMAVLFLGWFVAGSWFVSEAYGGWRAGHPHGRGWAIVISGLILMNTVPRFWMDRGMEGVGLAIRAAALAFAVALLIACFTTKMPTPRPATTA